ncbi:hypothetical protein [Pseudoalteromonas sp. MEBiC 03485]|uniref:hypothetical protein n=1 Tax=Pseudoalteromonas sp. MEBiC 03485 TaxID=2571103 RepID=UPI0010213DA4|nr:hypothetical protein [Pseudoalteromonas sp. MEBiC 03485]RZD19750.1 hypothetical protein EVU92_21340 [Pseudoalteromonas sp. MEBiC 03485]
MINLESNEARWADIASLLHEINDRLCELYKRDSIYVESPALYKTLVKLNDKLLCVIAKKTNTTQTLSFASIAQLPEVSRTDDASLSSELGLLQFIEIKLCEVCDRYEAILDNNSYATTQLKEFFRPLKIEIVGYVKSARRIIYSHF